MQKIFEFGISLSFINDDNDVDRSFTVILDLDENNTADQNWEIIKYIEVFRKLKNTQLNRILDDDVFLIHVDISEMNLVPIAEDISVYKQIHTYSCDRSTANELVKEIFPELYD